ncbi:VirD4-like conjugal transfer protein, CD1115 family [Limosilactobacillus caccae]|uniref:VirD4-like conjugal transfer protein, CD1115 family n=1 Tax=Limosilactobacillus caccae TaxID=1926284 RepID=UPI000970676A|nr:type IV secretory system conjugative DNA transfer family protein [Limosilactobacillus caccae]
MNPIGFCNNVDKAKANSQGFLKTSYTQNSTIFGKNTFLPLKHNEAQNDNVLVLGGSGTGKTHSFVEPNVLQANANFIIADAKGDILNNVGSSLQAEGYKIKVLNLIDPTKSMTYNPLAYLSNQMAVLSFARQLVGKDRANTTDPFWINGPATIIAALIMFVKEFLPEEEQTMGAVTRLFEMLNRIDSDVTSILKGLGEKDERVAYIFSGGLYDDGTDGEVTIGERLFQYAEEKNPLSNALKLWNSIKDTKGSDKTWGSLLSIAGTALAPYSIKEIDELLSNNQIAFTELTNPKTALFVLYDDADSSKNFLFSVFVKQLFDYLYKYAFKQTEKKLPVKVRFFLDDFKNIDVPNFEDYLATARSRNISICMMLQDESQLRAKFKDAAPSIIGNCSAYLLTGTMDLTMAEDAAKRFNMTPKAIRSLDSDNFLLDVGGEVSVAKRYDYRLHPNYRDKKYDFAQLEINPIPENERWASLIELLKNLPDEEQVSLKEIRDFVGGTTDDSTNEDELDQDTENGEYADGLTLDMDDLDFGDDLVNNDRKAS